MSNLVKDFIKRGTAAARAALTPTALTEGRQFSESDTGRGWRDNGATWDETHFLNPMTTLDDLIVGGSSGNAGRLAKGSDGQVLTVDPSTHHLVWASPYADPLTTNGDLLVRSGGVTTRLAVGANGKFMVVRSGAPGWDNIANGDLPTSGIATGTYKSVTSNTQGINTAGTLLTGVSSEVLYTATADGVCANVNTLTSIVGTGVGSLTLGANAFTLGRTLRQTLRGYMSTHGIGVGTIQFTSKIGSTQIAQTAAGTPTTSLSNRSWEAVLDTTCRLTGASGRLMTQGRFSYQNGNSPFAWGSWEFPATTYVTFDTTAASQLIDFLVQWQNAFSDNTITCTNIVTEWLN